MVLGLTLGGAGAQDGPPSGGNEVDANPANLREPVSLDRLTRHSELLKAFNLKNVAEVASELGFTTEAVAIEGEYPVIILRDEVGAPVVVQPMVCDGTAPDDDCHGLLLANYLQGSLRFPGISLGQVNQFNHLQPYVRVHVGSGRMAIISRLVLSDYGTTRGNLGVELFSFRVATYNFVRYLSQVRGVAGASIADAGPLRALVPPGARSGFAAMPGIGGGEPDAVLPRLIERWRKTGVLKDMAFPVEVLPTTSPLTPGEPG